MLHCPATHVHPRRLASSCEQAVTLAALVLPSARGFIPFSGRAFARSLARSPPYPPAHRYLPACPSAIMRRGIRKKKAKTRDERAVTKMKRPCTKKNMTTQRKRGMPAPMVVMAPPKTDADAVERVARLVLAAADGAVVCAKCGVVDGHADNEDGEDVLVHAVLHAVPDDEALDRADDQRDSDGRVESDDHVSGHKDSTWRRARR